MKPIVLLVLVALVILAAVPLGLAFTTNPSTATDSNPRVTCNQVECVLVWLRSSSSVDVYYQRLDHSGNTIGSESRLTTGLNVPAFSVSAGQDSFLITWSDTNSRILDGRIVDKSGNVRQPAINTPTVYGTVASAYDSLNNRYIIIYDGIDLTNTSSDLFYVLVDAGSNQIVSRNRLFYTNTNELPASITFDKTYGHYVLSYINYTTNTQIRMAALDTQASRIVKQGTQTPIDIEVATVPGLTGGLISYNDIDKNFLVSWQDNSVGQGDIFGQLVNTVITIPSNRINDLVLSGSRISISTDPNSQLLYGAHFNRQESKHVVAWYTNKLASPGYGVYVQMLDKNGAKLITDTKLVATGSSGSETDIFFDDSTLKYLVPARTAQNTITLNYFGTNLATANPNTFVAPRNAATKKFTPTNLVTSQPIADGSKGFNTIPLSFTNETLGPRLIVDGLFNQGSVDVGDILIEATSNATAVNLVAARNIGTKHTLSVPNNNAGGGVRVCPQATTVAGVVDNCPGEIELSTVPFNHTSGISVSFGTFKTQNDIYLVSGLNSTGIGLLTGGPGPSPSPSPSPSPGGSQTQATLYTNHTVQNGSVEFKASYTYNFSGTFIPIANPTCTIVFGDIAGTFPMTYTPSLGGAINLYTRPFTASAASTYTVTCSHSNYTTETSQSNFTIQVTGGLDIPPIDVQAISPINGKLFNNTGDVEFICSAKDDNGLNSFKLSTSIPGGIDRTNQVAGKQNQTSWILRNIPRGNYTWTCEAEDSSGQKIKSAQRSFSIDFTSSVVTTCRENWDCLPSDFSSITCPIDGIKKRVCVDKNSCNNAVPLVSKPDTERCISAGGAVCREDWDCIPVGPCTNGKQALTCTDKNNCSNPTPVIPKSTSKACGAQTGAPGTTSGGDLLSNPLILVLIIAIVVLAVLFFVIRKRKKSKTGEEETEEDEYADEEDELREPAEGEYTDENQGDDQGEQSGEDEEEK
ncbi:MAG: hypothetical protein HY512_00640 [Candidatus Aenigmarchaeota archaeon]|nr:hypothetical protein [Candidatus Aenigmarchaeota archaeon]